MGTGSLRATAAVVLGLSAAAIGFAPPAYAMTYGPGAPTSWIFTDSATPTAAPADPGGDTPVGSFLAGGIKHVHRDYFTYDLTGLRGQALHQAVFSSAETSVQDCGTASPIEVWRTTSTGSSTTWANPPAEVELLRAAEFGPGTPCPDTYLGVDVLAQVDAAVARHDRTITFEVRIGAGAEDKIRTGRMMRPFRLTVAANQVPTLSPPATGCGTPDQPAAAGSRTTLTMPVSEPARVTYAIWPVDHPDQRKQFGAAGRVDLSGYPDGTVLAWAGQARDADDTSAWSAPCYLTVDNTAPGTPPVISSAPCVDSSNLPGEFVLDAGGDRDTVAFAWHDDQSGRSGQIDARRPGGRARLTAAPDLSSDDSLEVSAVDAAGNQGPAVSYDVCSPPTAGSGDLPGAGSTSDVTVWSDAAPTGVGLPAHLTISTDLTGVRRYLYSVDGGPERSVPYAYQATVPIVPTHAGTTVVTVRSQLADGTRTPAASLDLAVSSAPVLTPAVALGSPAIAGRIGSVKLSPGEPGVSSYRYTFDAGDGEQTVAAGPDGTATVQFAPDRPGWQILTATSVSQDGTVSATRRFPVVVADPQVRVAASWPTRGPALGMGVPGTFRLLGDLADQTSQYLWHVDDGPVQVVPRDPAAAYTEIPYTPAQVGPGTFAVQRKFRDGSLSPVTEYHFEVGTLPLVAADPLVSAAGRVTTLSLSGGMPGVVSFDYQITGDSDGAVDGSGTVLADSGGAAQVAFTPPSSDGYRVIVTGHTANGTSTGTTTYLLAAS